jgi:hypothetical protein
MSDAQKEIELTREQLARAERALEAIRRDVLPVNEARYRLMAEGYVEQIQRLRTQIDAYLGIDAVLDSQSSVVISLEGAKVQLGDTAVGVLTKVVDAFRRGLQSLVAFRSDQMSPQSPRGRHKRWVEQLCDLPLVAVQPGSVRVVLGEPDTEGLFGDEDRSLLQENLRVLFAGVRWAANENMDCPPEIEADSNLRHLLVRVLLNLTPPRNSPVEAVGFRGAAMGHMETIRLRSAARQRLNKALADFEHESPTEVAGVIREVDLDTRTFCLRERPEEMPDLDCEYDEANEGAVKTYLDEPVILTGILHTSRKTKKKRMEVESIEPDLSTGATPLTGPTESR